MRKEAYKQKQCYWGGLKPNSTLKKYLVKFPKGKTLDIGAGSGRNSVFLAKNGFEVEAVDKIEEELEKIKITAKKYQLKIKTKACNVNDFKFGKNKHSLIVAIHSLDFLKKSEFGLIINKIKKSIIANGFIYLSVFSTKDPMYKLITEKGIGQIEENTFYLPKSQTYRHFFTKKELREKFENFKIIILKQKQILDKGHGEPHHHDIIELLAQKEKTAK
ncbi:MAG: Methyltransferase type 11 [Candidatus Azambacteria bacterium GW2011_GWE1_42_9]|nr:MAG: Methyltransferase type 11 [Candidatus Azambacteria bacterium GW2011_GWF1_41_10]KKS49433.1 MAG: Methyltransferase type 11 [Candidatus Azambacteria bacterium GW2011_GWF2_42_22]KKS69726.1 MAG: Methyltransferase type 11 [Candidatus Azambacteria bacterium GW2011_GWA2_42_62]KKS74049.1 MAG: Methyltransferase type 11 [Candidatus Azambacteria bacterium GW2011_GWB1_42_72]KKS79089.1 MAG: Methyltransferase type 11 [Candidatus Azambacteria bacterium GW2011_GWE1_42_9]KKT03544.1 MAG: Methyltransferas